MIFPEKILAPASGRNKGTHPYKSVSKAKEAFVLPTASWLDKNKDNLPITPEQLRTALGDQHVQQIAKSLGIPMDKVLDALAKFLPAAVNAAGPAVAPPAGGKPSISA